MGDVDSPEGATPLLREWDTALRWTNYNRQQLSVQKAWAGRTYDAGNIHMAFQTYPQESCTMRWRYKDNNHTAQLSRVEFKMTVSRIATYGHFVMKITGFSLRGMPRRWHCRWGWAYRSHQHKLPCQSACQVLRACWYRAGCQGTGQLHPQVSHRGRHAPLLPRHLHSIQFLRTSCADA